VIIEKILYIVKIDTKYVFLHLLILLIFQMNFLENRDTVILFIDFIPIPIYNLYYSESQLINPIEI
jgi:hypothetical protein